VEREAVTSGALKSIGYDADARTLEVEFRTGRVYQYQGIAPETHAWLMRVENKGGFLNRMIIDRFPTREVTSQAAPGELDLEAALRASLESDDAP
jgi:hypothetical protein